MTKRKKDSNNLLKFCILFSLICLLFVFIIYISKLIFNKFIISKVNVIEIRPDQNLIKQADLEFLKNENIFDIDLSKVSLYLSNKYPEFASIRLYKRFPDKVIIELIKRSRFAQVKLGSVYCIIDKDFIVVSKEINPASNLIEIKGVKVRSAVARTSFVKSRQEKIATNIIEFFSAKGRSASGGNNNQYPRIICVDVSNLPDIKLTLHNLINVIISTNDFNEKIKLLLYILPKIKHEVANINYIDLRFKEPVINYKGR